MYRPRMHRLARSFAALAVPTVLAALVTATAARAVPITVVGTNDLHGRVERTAALSGHLKPLRALRAKDGGAVVVVDGGDMFQGTLESNLEEGKAVVAAYNAVGYDAVAIGNHEFDFGPAGALSTPKDGADDARGALKARAAEAKFPFLAANVIDDATGKPVAWPNVKATTTFTKAGVKIGVIGVTTTDTPKTTIASNFKGLRTAPLLETIQQQAEALRKDGCVVVVVAAHAGGKCGFTDDPQRLDSCEADAEIMKVARALPAKLVDVIVAGHTHQQMAHEVNGIAVIESWANGRGFGRVDLDVDIKNKTTRVVKIFPPRRFCGGQEKDDAPIEQCTPQGEDGAVVAVDQELLKTLAPALTKAKELRDRKLGVVVESEIKRGYDQESALGNLFADLMRESRPDAAVTLMNGGGIRQNIDKGELTYGEVFEMMPFDNRFAEATMTVAELKAVLEKNLSSSKKGGLLSISGVQVNLTCNKDGHAAVTLIDAKGKFWPDAKKIKVVTTDFVALGGDGGLGIDEGRVVVDEGEPVREHLVRAFEKRKGQTLKGDDAALFSASAPRMKNATQVQARCGERR